MLTRQHHRVAGRIKVLQIRQIAQALDAFDRVVQRLRAFQLRTTGDQENVPFHSQTGSSPRPQQEMEPLPLHRPPDVSQDEPIGRQTEFPPTGRLRSCIELLAGELLEVDTNRGAIGQDGSLSSA